MYRKINIKGFTLIEILVVIAIIGILSSIVLASLNSAREKAREAAIKQSLTNMISMVEINHDGDYSEACTAVQSMIEQIENNGGHAACYTHNDLDHDIYNSNWAVSAHYISDRGEIIL